MKAYVILIMLLVLAACGPGPGDGGVGDPLTGREGIVLEDVGLPDVVYGGEQFSVSFTVENKGITDVMPDEPGLFIVSYDKLYLRYVDSVSEFPDEYFWLDGRDQYRFGDRTFFTLYFDAYPIERFSEQVKTPILVTLCYPYTTEVTQNVCIENIRDAQRGAVACVNSPLRPQSPGAPIGVKSVEARTRRLSDDEGGGLAPSFRITLENYQGGIPSVSDCDADGNQQLNSVSVQAYLLDQKLDCGSEPSRFVWGEAVVNCFLPADNALAATGGNYISLLTVKADYSYRESMSVPVVIARE